MVKKMQFRHQRNSRKTHGNARTVKGGHAVIGKSTLSMNKSLKVICTNQGKVSGHSFLIGHVYLSGIWQVSYSRTNTTKTRVMRRLD
jgi:hypothetical protein